MKKIIYTAVFLLSAAITLTSCGDDDEGVAYSKTPAADVTGTYVGTLEELNTSNNTLTTSDATLTVSENGTYAISVQLESSSVSKSGVANIAQMSGGYVIENRESGTFGVTFTGIVESGVLTLKYLEKVKSGRQTIDTKFTFTGTKQ